MKKLLLVLSLVLIFGVMPCYATALVRMPTMEQVEKLCVPVVLAIDNEVHWFYYKHIIELGERGLSVVYGKGLAQVNHYPRDEVINYEGALIRYKEIKREYE